MNINNAALFEATKISCDQPFLFNAIGLVDTTLPGTLTFLDNSKFIEQINKNPNISGVITTSEISTNLRSGLLIIETDVPRWEFFSLYNYIAKNKYKTTDSVIADSAKIHATAYISPLNVKIGENTIIGPNVSILQDVEIGNNCIIQAGTVIGSEGFEHKKTSKGVLSVFHDGKVIIKNNVEIGANTCIDKGFSFRNTIIESEVRIDNLVHVAHGVSIGERSFIIASAMLGGSVKIHEDVWISPNTSIAPGIELKAKAFVSLGAIVTKDVEEDQQVTGNFAIPHEKFLINFKKSLNP